MTAWRFTQQDMSMACREGELGKKCICGLLFWRKEKAEGHSGWGEVPKPLTGGGGRRMRTQPPEEHSVQKFLTPSLLPPLQLSPLLPPGRPGIRAVFQDKKTP